MNKACCTGAGRVGGPAMLVIAYEIVKANED